MKKKNVRDESNLDPNKACKKEQILIPAEKQNWIQIDRQSKGKQVEHSDKIDNLM